jgi:hypothetical protein
VERRIFTTEPEELEALLLENASREKNAEQRVREGELWREIEEKKAHARMSLGAALRWQEPTKGTPNLAYPQNSGETREKLAEKVGMKKTSYEKAAKVVEAADRLAQTGKAEDASLVEVEPTKENEYMR